MKYFILSILFVLFYTSVVSQRCNHHGAFGQKTALGDTLDATYYEIHIEEFNFTDQTIVAYTTVDLTSKVDMLYELKLELISLEVDSVINNGQQLAYAYDGSYITIPMAFPLNTGESVEVTIHYHGQPFHEAWGGFHWAGQYAFNLGVGFESIPHNLGKTWFPCIDDFTDHAYYKYYITLETGKDAVCGGMLLETINNGNGTQTFVWEHENPIPTYLASVAVGDYAWWSDTYNGINEAIPVWIFTRPSDSANVDGSFQNLNAILAIYEEHFGPYPFERVGYVGTGIGAMEHATNIAYPHFAINGGLGNESLLAHELSHMWFGDNVTCASAEDMWLNEGWAVFADALYQEFLYSKEQYNEFLRETHKQVIQFCHTSGGDGSYFPINQIPQEITYGMSAYDRGATIAHSLRGYLGDEVFFDAMAAYNENFKFSYASSYDLRDFLTSHTGIDMTGWFDNWVFNSGTPHYAVDSFTVVQSGDDTDVTVYLKQKRHGPAFTGNANKVELTFLNTNWEEFSADVFFDGETGSATVTVPFSPEIIIPDLYEKQCDAVTDYKRTIQEEGSYLFPTTYIEMEVESIEDSAFVWAGHQWAQPDPLKTPIQGLTLSDYRFWKIDGIFPAGFSATGVFWYNVNSHLDDGLITNPEDSLVILYRPSPAYDWQFLDFTKIGLWNIGKLYVENIQPGEYTLGICDDTFVGQKEIKSGMGLNIYPNPSENEFYIDTNQPGFLQFYDIQGNLVDTRKVEKNEDRIIWDPKQLKEGTYFVRYNGMNNKILAVERLIVVE